MDLAETLEHIEKLMIEEAEILSSARPQDVIVINSRKLEALTSLEAELNALDPQHISPESGERLKRVHAQARSNAQALKAVGDALAALFERLRRGESVQVGSYDPMGQKILFARAFSGYEKKV